MFGWSDTTHGRTVASWRRELWQLWNEGNTVWTVRKVNELTHWMEVLMAARNGRAQETFDKSKFYFVNCTIGADAWPSIGETFKTPETTFDALGDLLLAGYKVSFNVNPTNDMTICSITDKREGSVSYGACLTGGADGWYDALRVASYKLLVLLEGEMKNAAKGDGSLGRIS